MFCGTLRNVYFPPCDIKANVAWLPTLFSRQTGFHNKEMHSGLE